MKTYNNQSGFAHLVLIAVAVLAAGGVGTTVAANYSRPGDLLYGLDRATEQVQLALAFTDGMKESTNLSLAKERLDEVKSLLSENDIDLDEVNEALKGFEENKSRIAALLANADAKHAKEVDDEFELRENEITKEFEAKQKAIETNREKLKKEYEAAMASGDTARAAQLKAQINNIESLLKDLENQRESAKKALEQQEKAIEQHQDSATKEQEAAEHEAEEQAEAEKKAQEEADEAAKKAAEAAAEAAKKASEN